MGWMGWTEAQTLSTTIPAIELAYQGRFELLKSIFGGKGADEPTEFIPATGRNIRRALMRAAGQTRPRDASPRASGSNNR